MDRIENNLEQALHNAVQEVLDAELDTADIVIEIPKDKSHSDYSTNVAMQLTRVLKSNPRKIAGTVVEALDKVATDIESCGIAGPGSINFTIRNTSLAQIITRVLQERDNHGNSSDGQDLKVSVEHVSANPTDDLHLDHARGAARSNSITCSMKAGGYDMCREYYVNDAGNQAANLGKSLQTRYREHLGLDFDLPEDGYHGEDVKSITVVIVGEYKNAYIEYSDVNLKFFEEEGITFELDRIQRDLDSFRVHSDVWNSEQSICDEGKVGKALEILHKKGPTYEEDGTLWFAATRFGGDKGRVLRKKGDSYTYLVPDIAYHKDKLDCGYDLLVDLLGADHHGYTPRLRVSIEALGNDPDKLQVDIIQMIRLVGDGEEVKTSKRLGSTVTIHELCEEIGTDTVHHLSVQCAVDTYLDLDLGLTKKQSNDNPIYCTQYAHARICSILRQVFEITEAQSFGLLTYEKEIALMKYISEFTNIVSDAARSRAPHKACNYAQKLARHFHGFYSVHKVIDPQQPELSPQWLILPKATKVTPKNALCLTGVDAIEKAWEKHGVITKKSMVDVAHDLMSTKKEATVFLKLWEEVCQAMAFTKQQEEGNITQSYSGLSLNDRFVNVGENKWDLRKRHTYYGIVVDTEEILTNEETDDDYKEDDAAKAKDEEF